MAAVARPLAVSVMPLENRREQFLTLATLGERLGYDALLLPETWAYDVTIVLAEAAVKTERIRVGSAILGVWNRSAATLAMGAATLASLSRGRFILGLGASTPQLVEGLHDVPFGAPLAQRRRRGPGGAAGRRPDDSGIGGRGRGQGARRRRVARRFLSDVDGYVLSRHADPLRVRQGGPGGAGGEHAEVRGGGARRCRGAAGRADRVRHAGRGAPPTGALVRGRRGHAGTDVPTRPHGRRDAPLAGSVRADARVGVMTM